MLLLIWLSIFILLEIKTKKYLKHKSTWAYIPLARKAKTSKHVVFEKLYNNERMKVRKGNNTIL